LTPEPAGLKRVLGLRDVVLFFVTTGTNLQWVATAGAAGPSALTVWVLGAFAMFVPLAACVVEMTSRHPEEGGLYVWTRTAFGPFAGFMTGWTYWCSNLPYFPGVLYFAAGNFLFAGGEGLRELSTSPAYFIGFSLFGLALATLLNLFGLELGKWLNNIGGITRWLATLVLIGIGAMAWAALGPATPITPRSLVPGLSLRDLVFFSSIAFAWTGPETASFMGDEIREPRRTVPRALFMAAPMIAAIYLLGTFSVLVALPAHEVTGLQGIMQAVERAAARLALDWLTPVAAVLMTVTTLGSVGAWLEAVARIPFAAGLDRSLPAAFGRLHPRWGTPVNALLTQALLTVVFVVAGQAGTSVGGAYQVMVSMTFLVTFIPFLFTFAATIKLATEPPPPGGWRVKRRVLVPLAVVGALTTAFSMALAAVPAPGEPDKALAVTKVVGGTLVILAAGVLVYFLGRARTAASNTGGPGRPA
jgi:glutamate:GABA antiporter